VYPLGFTGADKTALAPAELVPAHSWVIMSS
jgi:hypothetical protein